MSPTTEPSLPEPSLPEAPQERGAPDRVVLDGSGGIRLVGDGYGPPDGRPVLLLHGGGQTRHSWGGTAEVLARAGYRAVSADLRGHGDSEWAPDGDYTLEAFRADVVAWCSALGRPAVVGASMGGIAALVAAGAEDGSPPQEDLLSAIVLVDVAPRIEPEGVARIVAFMTAHPEGFATLDEAADHIAGYVPHRPRPTDLSGLAKNLRQGDDGRWRWHWDPRFMTGERVPRGATREDHLLACAHRLRVPALLVRGRMSDVVSEEGAAEFLAVVPHAEFADVSGAGHMVAGDRNDAFTDVVLAFLEGIAWEAATLG